MRIRKPAASTLALAVALLAAAPAVGQTVIAPDQGTSFDTGTVVTAAGNETTIAGGTLAGENLFHSFTQFDLAQGDIAQWVRGAPDAASIANVINRVTGGDPSDINGTLRVADMPNASFYFVNPAGILFGEGAAIDIAGSTYFSTGEVVRFADGASFSTVTPDGSTFSSAPPEAFGFLGGQGPIIAEGVGAEFARTDTFLSLTASDIAIQGVFEAGALDLFAFGGAEVELPLGDPQQLAGDGSIAIAPGSNLVSGSFRFAANQVGLFAAEMELPVDDVARGNFIVAASSLTIDGAGLFTTAQGAARAGDIVLVADTIEATASARVQSVTLGDGDAGDVTFLAGSLIADGSAFASFTLGAGSAGNLSIEASSLSLSNSLLDTQAEASSSGDAGSISLAIAGSLALSGTRVSSSGEGSGDAGLVELVGDAVSIEGSEVVSTALGTGGGGVVTIEANSLQVTGSSISSATQGPGDAGSVLVDASLITIEASQLFSSTFAEGNAGNVQIIADNLGLFGETTLVGSQAEPGSLGNAGNVTVQAGLLSLEGAQLSSSTFGVGAAGSVTVDADFITLFEGAQIVSRANDPDSGNAGSVTIDSTSLLLDRAQISTSTQGKGDGGAISIKATEIGMVNSSGILSNTLPGTIGKAGEITIETETFIGRASELNTSTFGSGDGGKIKLTASLVDLAETATIGSLTGPDSSGNAGSIEIDADLLKISRAVVSTSTLGLGNAGSLTITAELVEMTDGAFIVSQAGPGSSGNAGNVFVSTDIFRSDASQINTSTFGQGDGGILAVEAKEVLLTNLSFLSSQSSPASKGDAGAVLVSADIFVAERSQISSSTFGTGNAGLVGIAAKEVSLLNDSFVVSQAETGSTGSAGGVVIEADSLFSQASQLASSTFGSGDAGALIIEAGVIELKNSALTSQAATGATGNAGAVSVTADRFSVEGSLISSGTAGPGSGGLIEIAAKQIDVSASGIGSVTSGSGSAGAIAIQADRLVLTKGASISSEAMEGSSGNAGAVLFEIADRLVADSGIISSSTAGSGSAGIVGIKASVIELKGDARLASATAGSGMGGVIVLDTEELIVDDSLILSTTLGEGDAGSVGIVAGSISLRGQSQINSATFGAASAGIIEIATNKLTLNDSAILSSTTGAGNAGQVLISSRDPMGARLLDIELENFSGISTLTRGAGTAGKVEIIARSVSLADQSGISSSASQGSTGTAGSVSLTVADELALTRGSGIETSTFGLGDAGDVTLTSPRIIADQKSGIFSSSSSTGNAGSIAVSSQMLDLLEGGQISTDSLLGPAGDIVITMPDDGFLTLAGDTSPGVITTTSGPNTGGRITIQAPYAIISNGGSILALGEISGANVRISSDFFVSSADHVNRISVAGDLVLDSQFSDLSAGTEAPDIDFLDASSVLSGQCAAARATGQTSRFTSRVTGPYAPVIEMPAEAGAQQPAQPQAAAPSMLSSCG